ncbi:DUF4253 domain-containing protein [Saccharothrix sp. SC076]|nr:DUF4253 domain-containing protein [Saccharothrix obliqua]
MLGALDDDAEDFRPWGEGEVAPEDMSSPDDHDAAALLAEWWRDHTGPDEDDALSPAERDGVTAPYGDWPGLAPTTATTADPEHAAVDLAETLFAVFGTMRLGLVRAERGADALTALGWTGPVNCIGDTAEVSAVVRDWERRFGARVVGVGFDTLYLSVAAPPATREEALRVAAEHFAFCPDNVWQSRDAQTLAAYADRLVGERSWAFWWD